MIVEYDDLKRDLTTALSMLEGELTDAESWQIYARIVLGAYGEAVLLLRDLAAAREATDVLEFLVEVSHRAGLAGNET